MIDEVYSQKILQFAGNISHIGLLDNADAAVEKTSRLCGSKLKIYLKCEGGLVSAFAQEVRACALGQASAAIFAQSVEGASAEEIREAREQVRLMLDGLGEGPTGRFEAARILAPVKDYKSRHGSVMLVYDATVSALDEIAGKVSTSDGKAIGL